jgi:NADH dehydrogenase [ubiquinone] 1 alpha subcomplex assembly factor 5
LSDLKTKQRENAAMMADAAFYDYLKDEIARRLVDRISCISRDFSTATDVGCHSGIIAKYLGDVGNIQNLIQLDMSRKTLFRDVIPSQLSRANSTDAKNSTSQNTSTNAVRSASALGGANGGKFRNIRIVADHEYLPLAPASQDMIMSSMSLHWVNDLPSFFQQTLTALKPDGVFVGCMLAGETLQELRSALALADIERKGGVSPHLSPFARSKDIGDLMSSAGFTMLTVDVDTIQVPYPDMFTLIDHLQRMGEQNAPFHLQNAVSKDVFLAAAAIFQEMYKDNDDLIPVTFDITFMIGWRHHSTQNKAAKRGSAKAKIGDDAVLFPSAATN